MKMVHKYSSISDFLYDLRLSKEKISKKDFLKLIPNKKQSGINRDFTLLVRYEIIRLSFKDLVYLFEYLPHNGKSIFWTLETCVSAHIISNDIVYFLSQLNETEAETFLSNLDKKDIVAIAQKLVDELSDKKYYSSLKLKWFWKVLDHFSKKASPSSILMIICSLRVSEAYCGKYLLLKVLQTRDINCVKILLGRPLTMRFIRRHNLTFTELSDEEKDRIESDLFLENLSGKNQSSAIRRNRVSRLLEVIRKT